MISIIQLLLVQMLFLISTIELLVKMYIFDINNSIFTSDNVWQAVLTFNHFNLLVSIFMLLVLIF